MADTPDTPRENDGAPPSTVQTGILCVRCAYDLGGLATDGLCPECGAAVADTLAGDHLAHADPEWRDAVLRGLRMCARGMKIFGYLIAGWIVAVIVFMITMAFGFAPLGFGAGLSVIWLVAAVLGLYAIVLMVAGGWWLSRIEPSASAQGQTPLRSVLGRWAPPAGFSVFILGIIVLRLIPPGLGAPVLAITNWLVWTAVIVSMASWLRTASELARRTNGSRLAFDASRLARRMMFWMCLAAGVAVGGQVAVMFDGGIGSPIHTALEPVLGGLAALTGLGMFFVVLSARARMMAIDRQVHLVLGR